MLARVRLQLTIWYVAVLLAIICIVVGAAYVVLSRALDAEVDDSLQSSARGIAAQIEERGERPTPGTSSAPATGSGDDDEADDGKSGGDAGEYEGLEYFSGSGNNVFYLVLSPDGDVLLNPLNVPTTDFVDLPAVQEAVDQGEAWRTIATSDQQTRVLYVATTGSPETRAVVEVGRSLERHNSQLSSLLKVLLATGAGGIVLASAGGFWLAGRALQPTRDAMERQRQFVSDASHELRTPLTLIRASAEAIQGGSAGQLDPADKASLDDIVAESERMSGLVDELLTLARLEEGRLELVRESVDGANLIASAAREAGVLSAGRHTVSTEGDAAVPLHCDPVRIGQVLRILVDNAVRHTPASGSITLGVRNLEETVEFWVQDTGPGIDPEHLERVFERFYRLDAPRSRQTGGSGLGLSIAQGIVEAHDGSIEAVSGPDNPGTRIVFVLPK